MQWQFSMIWIRLGGEPMPETSSTHPPNASVEIYDGKLKSFAAIPQFKEDPLSWEKICCSPFGSALRLGAQESQRKIESPRSMLLKSLWLSREKR